MLNRQAARPVPRERLSTPSFLRRTSAANAPEHGLRRYHEGQTPEDMARIEGETNMAQRVVERLRMLYPGHAWECTVDSRTGGVQLRIAVLMTGPHCFFFGFDDISTENAFNAMVQRAAGELLERYRIPRTTFDVNAYMDAERRAVFHVNQKVPE